MVQSFDYNVNKPNYNAVKINIKKPEINATNNKTHYVDDNGIYNAVNIEIDNPTVNTEPQKVYDYPYSEEIVTCDMFSFNPIPVKYPVNYHTTNVILPKVENEMEVVVEKDIASEINESEETDSNNTKAEAENSTIENKPQIEESEETNPIEIPAPNYTTVEAEKGSTNNEITFNGSENAPKDIQETSIAFKAENIENKRPEIIPGEDITPEVDIPLVISNLSNDDYDVQAQQMEEIARVSFDNAENAVPYIVREVFSNLIDISKKDTTNLKAPTQEQINARKKLITNFLIIENSKQQNQKDIKLPYQITEEDFVLANELSPMEMAERNKEYALYTMAILSKIYTDEVEKQTGNVVPFTDLPGSAAMVDALRYSPNAGVKIAAIDALRHIQRKEYAEELYTLYSLAQADPNPQVAISAARALKQIEQQKQ